MNFSCTLVWGLLIVLFRYSASRCFRASVCSIARKLPAGVSTEKDLIKHQGVSSSPSVLCNFTAAPFPSSHSQESRHDIITGSTRLKLEKTLRLYVLVCFWVRNSQHLPNDCHFFCGLNNKMFLLFWVVGFSLFTSTFSLNEIHKSHWATSGSCSGQKLSNMSYYMPVKWGWAGVSHIFSVSFMITVISRGEAEYR